MILGEKMNKKVCELMLCTPVIVCSITGCTKDYETIKPPEVGWSMEKFIGVTNLCGKQLPYPLT